MLIAGILKSASEEPHRGIKGEEKHEQALHINYQKDSAEMSGEPKSKGTANGPVLAQRPCR